MSERTDAAQHLRWTDPGPFGSLLDDLPTGIDALRAVARGLITHYMAPVRDGGHVPADRPAEVDTGDVRAMLGRILALDLRPLAEPHPLDRRLVGCCRDAELLLCAFLRHRGVDYRARIGFRTYLVPGSNQDHVIVEVRDPGRAGWRMVDAQFGPEDSGLFGIPFDPADLAPGAYVPATRA